jgi:hypothetical protein
MTADAKPVATASDPGPVLVYRLRDGTRLMWNPASRNGGPAIEINDFGRVTKVVVR